MPLFIGAIITVLSGCQSASQVTDPIRVIQSFHDGLNSGDLEKAMSFVDDEATFFVDNFNLKGKTQVLDFYESIARYEAQYTLSNLHVDGETVRWDAHWDTIEGEGGGSAVAVVQNGKIVSFTGE
jgi:ketosteroid isomerase-like protein